jgi:hypothetical protein
MSVQDPYVTCFPNLRLLRNDSKCKTYIVYITVLRMRSKTVRYCKHQQKFRQQIELCDHRVTKQMLSVGRRFQNVATGAAILYWLYTFKECSQVVFS